MRLDKFLVEKGIFDTRNKAQIEIKNSKVYVNGNCIIKNSFQVDDKSDIEIIGTFSKYVSKGGLKLEKALNEFNINLKDKVMCDIGSSTGGFSDCAIKHGIKKIYAIDVGSNQMVPQLRNNKCVILYENTDFRKIDKKKLSDTNIITIDVSFISVTKLINEISLMNDVNEVICLIKPQFECGMSLANKYKGVILNRGIHYNVIKKIINEFNKINFNIIGLTYSPIKGGSGNIEYLAYFSKENISYNYNIVDIINDAFEVKN